ncbi:TrmB family transcriptional regulator [Thermoproteota archaeon]
MEKLQDGPNSQILRDLGFTDGEIKVYFALFALGETTVGPISKKSGVTHAKVYPILAKLIGKGLVSHTIKEGRKHFSATDPNSLLEFVDKKVRSLEGEKQRIKDIIPALLAKQKELEKVQYSRVFEGFKGLRALFYELFGTNKDKEVIRVFGLNELIKETGFISFFRFYHELRRKNDVELNLILNKDIKSFIEKAWERQNMLGKTDKIKFVDISFPSGVFIFKDHVINIVADEKVTAFDIKSKQNAERYRKFFLDTWNKIK